MLWYKIWLETRWRMMLPFDMILFAVFTGHNKGQLQVGHASPGHPSVLNFLPFFWMIAPLMLAGSGVNTEAPFRALKGLHGSTFFTLGLPVSRFRLFATRVGFGMLGTAGLIAIACCLAGILFPEIRAQTTLGDVLRYAVTVLLCSTAIFGLSTLFATFLDQQLQVMASMASIFLLGWLFIHTNAPGSFNVFRALADGSPLVTHVIPWPAIFVCLGVGAVSLLAAWTVLQTREY